MSKFKCLYIDSDVESEDKENNEEEDEDEDEIDEAIKSLKNMLNKYKDNNSDHGEKDVNLTDITITEIEQLNFACPSDWKGKLSNDMTFYARWRGGSFRLFVYKQDHDFNMFCDSPLIELFNGDRRLENALDPEDYNVLLKAGMLELCGLKLAENCTFLSRY